MPITEGCGETVFSAYGQVGKEPLVLPEQPGSWCAVRHISLAEVLWFVGKGECPVVFSYAVAVVVNVAPRNAI